MKVKITPVRLLLGAGIAALVLVGAAEVAVRFTGITDFPTYEDSAEIGYALHPNQSGRFLNKNRWIINDKQQNAEPWKPGGKADILLLGDSLVWGGNPLDQGERLGDQLEARLPGSEVWPAAAGSWSVPNEVAYLNRYPEVAADAEDLVWVLNTGDLDGPSRWQSEISHPRTRPWSALLYAWEKYGAPRFAAKAPPPEEPPPPSFPPIRPESITLAQSKLAVLLQARPDLRVTFVVYPTKDELLRRPPEADAHYERFLAAVREIAGDSATVIDLRADSRWNVGLYRDGIHPSAAGNAMLAEILAERLR